jgi:hypothetical protein
MGFALQADGYADQTRLLAELDQRALNWQRRGGNSGGAALDNYNY